MSSITNTPAANTPPAQYTDQQKQILQSIETTAKQLGQARSTGDASAVQTLSSQIKDLYTQAGQNGISRQDVTSFRQQNSQEAVGSFLSSQKSAGKPLDDQASVATLHNNFSSFAKQHGLDSKKPESHEKWRAAITPSLQKSGLSDDDIDTSLNAAANYQPQGQTAGDLQRRDVRI